MTIEREKITYIYYDVLVTKLLEMIKDGKYDKVYGVPRGGLAIALHMSHNLNIPLLYDIDLVAIGGKNILIVDDVCDSGKTLARLCDIFSEYRVKYTTATLHAKPRRIFEPDYYVKEVNDNVWIEYPWEKPEANIDKGYMTHE